jgi:hypothetical protein
LSLQTELSQLKITIEQLEQIKLERELELKTKQTENEVTVHPTPNREI